MLLFLCGVVVDYSSHAAAAARARPGTDSPLPGPADGLPAPAAAHWPGAADTTHYYPNMG